MTVIRRPRGARTGHRPWPLCRNCTGVALDMGSARTRAWVAGRGMIFDVPTVTFPGAGAVYPIQRGSMVVVTAPVLDGYAYRTEARTAVEVLRPRSVLTVPAARAVAVAAGADLTRPLLVMDVGAHLSEVVLLVDGAVFDARRTALGTGDIDDATPAVRIGEAVVDMTTSMLRQDRTSLTIDALGRGPLLAGGGALRPEITCHLAGRLHAPLRAVPAPHTAALRGAAKLLETAHSHPSTAGTDPPDELPH